MSRKLKSLEEDLKRDRAQEEEDAFVKSFLQGEIADDDPTDPEDEEDDEIDGEEPSLF
jgi:hypothetical protein